MATVTGHLGTSATGNTDIRTAKSLGVTCPSETYPNTNIKFLNNGSGGSYSYWRNTHSSSTVVLNCNIYLCDSAGSNKVKIFTVSGVAGGGTTYIGKDVDFTNASKLLKGKALYIIADGTNVDYLRFRGQSDIKITTSTMSYTLSKASSPAAGGGTTFSASSAASGAKVQVKAGANTGYSFSSWTKSSGTFASTTANPTTFTMPAANATVTANFSANNYSIAKASSPSAGGSVTLGASTATYNSKVNVTATANTGYSFSSWTKSSGSLSSTTSNPTTFTVATSNATVTANFTANNYSVAKVVSPSGGGSITLGSSSGTYNQKINVTASANTGYSFSSWAKSSGTLSSTTTNPTTFTLSTSNATVTGYFTHNTYSVGSAVSPSGGGSVDLSSSSGYYNDKIKITATASTGYTFSSWSKSSGTLDSTTANPTTFTLPAGNSTVTANFTHNTYSISKAVSPSGSGSVTLGATSGYYNDKVQIVATPSTGYEFTNWTASSGTLSNASSATTTLTLSTSNTTVTANFAIAGYNVTTSVSPSGSGTLTASPSLAQAGATVTLTATPASGYIFENYTSNPSVAISHNTFTMPSSAVAVTANFASLTASTCTLDKASYVGGDTAVLTINAASSSFSHKYKLDFGDGMNTGWIDVQAGVSSVNILVPAAWCLLLTSGTSKSGGILTLETYYNGSSLGSNNVTNLTYTALDNTIPKLNVWRCDSSGNKTIDGEYGKYSITVPSSIAIYTLTYGNTSYLSPAPTGDILPNDKKLLLLESNHMIHLEMTYQTEVFSISKDIPKIIVVKKAILA